jgi:GxxExxY protein
LTFFAYRAVSSLTRSRGDAERIELADQDEITGAIVDASLRIHRDLGPGLLESVYEAILARVLERRGFRVERQRSFGFEYEGLVFQNAYRVDLWIEGQVIVEIKSVEQLEKSHSKQLLTYLKLSRSQVGLLINFGAPTLREGLRRIVNDFKPSASPRLRVNQVVAPLRANEISKSST